MPGTEKALKPEVPSYLWRKNYHLHVPLFSTANKKFSISQKIETPHISEKITKCAHILDSFRA
jgi:hypothetical protein